MVDDKLDSKPARRRRRRGSLSSQRSLFARHARVSNLSRRITQGRQGSISSCMRYVDALAQQEGLLRRSPRLSSLSSSSLLSLPRPCRSPPPLGVPLPGSSSPPSLSHMVSLRRVSLPWLQHSTTFHPHPFARELTFPPFPFLSWLSIALHPPTPTTHSSDVSSSQQQMNVLPRHQQRQSDSSSRLGPTSQGRRRIMRQRGTPSTSWRGRQQQQGGQQITRSRQQVGKHSSLSLHSRPLSS